MLTDIQKTSLLREVLLNFKLQKGLNFNAADFDLHVDKPNQFSLCSIYIYSKRADDNFKIKLYVTGFNNFTSVQNFVLTQEQGYSTGLNDEIHVANCLLNRTEYRSFELYLYSAQFLTDIVNATDRIRLEDGSGYILMENSGYLNLEN
jgi:hypothetical protein